MLEAKPVLRYEGGNEVKRLLEPLRMFGIRLRPFRNVQAVLNACQLLWLLELPAALCRLTVRQLLAYTSGRRIAAALLTEATSLFVRKKWAVEAGDFGDPERLLQSIRRSPEPEEPAARYLPDRRRSLLEQEILGGRLPRTVNMELVQLASESGGRLEWNWSLVQRLRRIHTVGFYRSPDELLGAVGR